MSELEPGIVAAIQRAGLPPPEPRRVLEQGYTPAELRAIARYRPAQDRPQLELLPHVGTSAPTRGRTA